jgi:FAD/FMN-containing dehydrogenase
MNAPSFPLRFAEPRLAQRLRKELDGEVLFDRASRGRYSTDASIYQIEPIGIVVPRSEEAARMAIAIAAEEGVPILPRGAGSSQCGQAVGAALVVDHTKYLNRILSIDGECAVVQPGVVLDALNAALRPKGCTTCGPSRLARCRASAGSSVRWTTPADRLPIAIFFPG